MRIVLDTNVLVSAVFFGGPPGRVLEAWRDGKVRLVLSPAIIEEYRSVGERLSDRYEGIDHEPFLALLVSKAMVVPDRDHAQGVTADPDDDKFLACALEGGAQCVVSGDQHLLETTGWRDVEVCTPREYCRRYLE